jgi:hypothetical protein
MHHPKSAWNDYFTATPVTTFGPGEYNSRQYPTASNVHVLNCLFNTFTSESYGGALYCANKFLLVELSSFFSCKTSGRDGGAICYDNSNGGQCVLNGICGKNCSSSTYGQFSRMYVDGYPSYKNYVNYSSISRCVNENSDSYKTLRLNGGNVCCISTNISMNKCYYRSGIYCCPYTDTNSITSSVLYSTFADNNAIGDTCIKFNNGGKFEIKCCNIIRNTQGNLGEGGTINVPGNLMIEDSCIFENIANYIFYATSYYSSKITLSNCTVDKTTNTGSFNIQKTATKYFILALNHMSTQNCHARYDAVGYLTPIIRNQKCYCTNQKFFLQIRNEDVISLISIMIFNFIHLNASK